MIGIITFHRAVNYGAILQCYALTKKIEELGGKSEVINYYCPLIEESYKAVSKNDFFPIKVSTEYLRHIIYVMSIVGIRKKKKKKFREFLDKNFILSEICKNEGELKNIDTKYRNVISGSDQVWNVKLTGNDSSYFLDFVSNSQKKFSYAACFGNEKDELLLEDDKIALLKQFNKISIREKNSEKFVEEKIGRKPYIMIDPVMLIDQTVWDNILVKPKTNKYLLVYDVCDPLKLLDYAYKIAEKEKLEIIYIKDKKFKKKPGITYVTAVSPEEFVGYFKYADIVLTNSFHGTAFSIIYKKRFMVEIGNACGANKRASELIKLLSLEVCELNDENMRKYNNKINWGQVNDILSIHKKNAIEYLNYIIHND